MTRSITLTLVVLSIATSPGIGQQSTDVQGTLRDRLEPCELPRAKALCGSYQVWEDRESKRGRTIDLNLIVVPAEDPNPRPDPVFFIIGGPGLGSTQLAAGLAPSTIQRTRDIVLVDQRGTGKSNPLHCRFAQLPPKLQARGLSQHLVSSLEYAEACRKLLEAEADLTLYTTPVAMDDLDDVRAALGYGRINLWGLSYGARAAQVYLRRHGENVRTLILTGTDPMDARSWRDAERNAQRALNLLFQDCDLDPDCHASYPYLRSELRRLLSSLPESEGEETGLPTVEKAPLPKAAFLTAMRSLLSSPGNASRIPLLIHTAAQGDFTIAREVWENQVQSLDGSLARGMALAVNCADVAPQLALARSRPIRTVFDTDDVPTDLAARCQLWPSATLPPAYHAQVESDVPTLLTTGNLDPLTPPSNAEYVASYLTNAIHVVFRGAGHTTFSRANCLLNIMQSFMDREGSEGLDTSCAQEGVRPPFLLPDAEGADARPPRP